MALDIKANIANIFDNLTTKIPITGTGETLATYTNSVSNTAINLMSKQHISDTLGVPTKKAGKKISMLPVTITMNVDHIAIFSLYATEFNAQLAQDIQQLEKALNQP